MKLISFISEMTFKKYKLVGFYYNIMWNVMSVHEFVSPAIIIIIIRHTCVFPGL